jgi:hypothetical protein
MKLLSHTLCTAAAALTLSALASANDFTLRIECTLSAIDGLGAALPPFSNAQIGDPLVVEYVLDVPGQLNSAALFVNGGPIPGVEYQIDYAASKATFLGQSLPLTDTVPLPYEDGVTLASAVNGVLGYSGVANGVFSLTLIDFIQPGGAVISSDDLAALSGSTIPTGGLLTSIVAYSETFPNFDGVVFTVDRVSVAPFVAPPVTYCTSGTSTSGCTPTISASGQPSASAASSCTLSVANLEGQKQGLIFYGLDNSGFSPLPWSATSTSFFCVKSPTQRTLPQLSGGTPGQCDGAFTLDWNNFLATFAALGEPFAAGDKLYAQGWYRDPPASKTTNLTNAVELTFVP